MSLPLFLFAFFSAVTAQKCTDQAIFLNGKWSQPLTAIQDNAYCTLKFSFSPSNYIYMSLKGMDMATNSDGRDAIFIEERYSFEAASNSSAYSTFVSNQAWATNITIILLSRRNNTQMKYQFDIEVFPLTLGQNNQDTYDVAKDFQPQLLYFSDLVEGGTYYSNSHTRDVVLQTAILSNTYNDTNSLGNIFVFSGGVYQGSLYDVYKQEGNPFLASDIIQKSIAIYVARKPEIEHGVIILNDLDNFNQIYQAFPIYLPLNRPDRTQYVYEYADYKPSGADGAIILVGNKEGTPFDVTEFTVTQDLGGAFFSATSGGIQSYHKNSTRVTTVPMHFTGNLNTVYLSNGSGKINVVVN